jgi:hypothetical protein
MSSLEKRMILDGRPSYLYEVDHIIPLWAGGSDTNANIQILSRPEHDKKTKAQAVAYTLLANRRISPGEAKVYAMTWNDRDLSDIPELDQFGTIPLESAEVIKNKWDEQATQNPRVSFKDFLKSVPDGAKNLTANLRGFFGKESEGPKTALGGVAEEFVKGVASGVTGGWIPYEAGDNSNIAEVGSGVVGNIAGALIPIGALSKAFGWGFKATSKLAKTGGAAKMFGVGSQSAQGVSTMIKAPSFLKSKMVGVAFNNIASNTAALTLYGQLTQDAVDNRVHRFWEDLGYGVLTPFAGRLFSAGASKAGAPVADKLFAQMGTEALGVGTAAAMISIMADPERPTDALINAGIMAALHSAGMPMARKQAAEFKRVMDDEATRMANNVLHTYVPERFKLLKPDEPVAVKFGADDVIQARAEAMKKLDEVHATGRMAPEDYFRERSSIFVATSVLSKPTIDPNLLRNKEVTDLLSLAGQSRRLEGGTITAPAEATAMLRTLDEKMLTNSYKHLDGQAPSGKYPTGTIRLSGMADKENPYPELLKEYFKNLSNGKASPTILLVDRPELAPAWKGINNAITPAQVKAKTHKPFENPQNAVQAYGIMTAENGGRTLVPLGWVPRKFHIEESGSINSFNNSIKKTKGSQGGGKNDPFYHDPMMNKDVIGGSMKQNGLRFMVANLHPERSSVAALESKQAFMHITLNDENWAKSLHLNDLLGSKVSTGGGKRSVPQMIADVNNSLNVKKKQQNIKEIRERVTEPADEIFNSPTAVVFARNAPEGAAATQSMLRNAREALLEDTPEALAKRMNLSFGTNIDETKAAELLARRNEITVKELFTFLGKESDRGVKEMVSQVVKPFLESSTFRKEWDLGKTFPELRVLGGLKTQPTTVQAAQVSPVARVSAKEAVPQNPKQLELEGLSVAENKAVNQARQKGGVFETEPVNVKAEPIKTGEISQQSNVGVSPVAETSASAGSPLATMIAQKAKTMPEFAHKGAATTAQIIVPKTTRSKILSSDESAAAQAKARFDAARLRGDVIDAKKGTFKEEGVTYSVEGLTLKGQKPLSTVERLQSDDSVYPLSNRQVDALNLPPSASNIKASTKTTTPKAKPVEKLSLQEQKRRVNENTLRAFTESADDMMLRGMDEMENMVVPSQRGQYVKQLKGLISSLEPGGRVPMSTGSGARKFTPSERATINKRVKDKLRARAEQLVEQNFSTDNEISFKTGGIGKDPDVAQAMRVVIKADTARGLGNIEEAKRLLKSLPEEDLRLAEKSLGFLDGEGEGMLSKLLASETKKPAQQVAEKPTQKEFDDLNRVREKEGKERVDVIKKNLKSKDDPYQYAWAKAMDEGLTRIMGDYTSKQNIRLLGSVFAGSGLRGKKTRQFDDLFKTTRGEGDLKEISHTKDYLIALGDDDPKAISQALKSRKKDIARNQSDKDLGSMSTKENLSVLGSADDSKLGSEELSGGLMRLLSETQDMNQVSGNSKLWTTLYPGLNASLVSGTPATVTHGVRDARAQLQFIMNTINQRVGSNKTRYGSNSKFLPNLSGKKADKPFFKMTEAEQKAYKEENEKATRELFKDILERVKKDLEEGS